MIKEFTGMKYKVQIQIQMVYMLVKSMGFLKARKLKLKVMQIVVGLVPKSITLVLAFKVEHLSSTIILTGESKVEIENQKEKQTDLNIMSHYEGIKEEPIKYIFDLYPRVIEKKYQNYVCH